MLSVYNIVGLPYLDGTGKIEPTADSVDADHVLVRNLVEIFDEPRPLARRQAVHDIFEPDCLVCGPDQALIGAPRSDPRQGWDGVTSSARRLREAFPDHYFSVRDAHRLDPGVILLRWSYGPIWDHRRYHGIDVALRSGSRIQALRSRRETPSDVELDLTASRLIDGQSWSVRERCGLQSG